MNRTDGYTADAMTLLSPTLPPPRSPRPTLPTDVEELFDMADRLNGLPVPGVRLTERQFVDWCPAEMRAEWENGEVILMPPENIGQSDREGLLLAVVRLFVEHHDLGRVFAGSAQVRLPTQRRRRVPDLVFVSTARLHLIRDTFIDGPPDLAVEIVSPDSVERDWVTKRAEYEAAGVREYWIVDPRHERFVAYALHGKKYRAVRPDDDGRVHSKVLKGLYVRPAWLWRSPLPKVAAVLKELGVR